MTNAHPLNTVSETVGDQVRRLRTDKHLTVDDLADRCIEVGAPHLTTAALYALESGRREPGTGRRRRLVSVDELVALSRALSTTPSALLGTEAITREELLAKLPEFRAMLDAELEPLKQEMRTLHAEAADLRSALGSPS